ncbi:MAG: hypothetical protein ACI4D7_06415 [Lachnospiraceae bacterium]
MDAAPGLPLREGFLSLQVIDTSSIVPFIRCSVKKYFTDFSFFKHFHIRIRVHPRRSGKWLKEEGMVQKYPNIPSVCSLLTVYWQWIGQNNGMKSPDIQYSEEFLIFLRVNAPEKLDFGYLKQDSH